MFESTSKRFRTGTLAGALILAAVPLTQALIAGPQDGPPQGLIPIDPPAGEGEPLVALDEPALDAELWAAKLTDADLDRREQAFDAALDAARRSPAMGNWLEAQAAGTDGLAWTARLLLREIKSGSRRAPGGFDAMPFGDPFAGDPFQRFFGNNGAAPRGFGIGGPSIFDAFDDLFSAPGGRSQSRTFGFRMGPNGVEVETSEGVDGDQRTEVYQADDLESLLREHPELRDRFGLKSKTDEAMRTDILGVRVTPTQPGDNLPEGLFVADTIIGTIAHLLGVERGSVLVSLNGQALRDVSDISAILTARPEGGELRLTWIDANGLETTRVWRPGGRQAGEPEEREEL
ncbi:MAG: hypothetical protein AAFZ65_16695 [Planctomycetota bacterium]